IRRKFFRQAKHFFSPIHHIFSRTEDAPLSVCLIDITECGCRSSDRLAWTSPRLAAGLLDAAARLSAAEVCANKQLARPFKASQCLLEDRFRSHVLRFGLEITQQPMA